MSIYRHLERQDMSLIVFRGVYVPHLLYPVYHQWAFGLVPGLCYCKQCHDGHSCACNKHFLKEDIYADNEHMKKDQHY